MFLYILKTFYENQCFNVCLLCKEKENYHNKIMIKDLLKR